MIGFGTGGGGGDSDDRGTFARRLSGYVPEDPPTAGPRQASDPPASGPPEDPADVLLMQINSGSPSALEL